MSSVEFLEWQTRAQMLADVEQLRAQNKDYEMSYRAIFDERETD